MAFHTVTRPDSFTRLSAIYVPRVCYEDCTVGQRDVICFFLVSAASCIDRSPSKAEMDQCCVKMKKKKCAIF